MNFSSKLFRVLESTCQRLGLSGIKLSKSLEPTRATADITFLRKTPRFTRTIPLVFGATAAVGTTLFKFAQSTAEGQGDQHKHRDSSPVNSEWTTTRLKNDICHLTPGISELLLDIIDLLQENFDNYVSSMNKRVKELESNLRKYGSTISLNLADIDAENFTLTDPGSQEIKIHKKAYRDAYLKCSEMVSGVNLFLLSAHKFGTVTCVERSQRELDEIFSLIAHQEQKIREHERRLEMAEKHFKTKLRRTTNGQQK